MMTLGPSVGTQAAQACSALSMFEEEKYLRALAFPLPAQADFFAAAAAAAVVRNDPNTASCQQFMCHLIQILAEMFYSFITNRPLSFGRCAATVQVLLLSAGGPMGRHAAFSRRLPA